MFRFSEISKRDLRCGDRLKLATNPRDEGDALENVCSCREFAFYVPVEFKSRPEIFEPIRESTGIHRCTWDRLLRPPFPHRSIVRQRFLAILAFTLCASLMMSGKKERKISGALRAAGFRLFDS